MNQIKKGATIWARQTIESDIFFWKPDKWFKIWFYIVNQVNHEDSKQFKRGEGFMTYESIKRGTKSTKGQVDSFIRWVKKSQMLTTRQTTRGMIVKVLKYDYYQTLDNYYYNKKNDKTNEPRTNHARTTNDTINKNDKNIKNDKNREGEKTLSPKETMKLFLEEENYLLKIAEYISKQKSIDKTIALKEIKKFKAYWTEPNSSGNKQRWEMERTFELSRRLTTWFNNVSQFKGQNKKSIKVAII